MNLLLQVAYTSDSEHPKIGDLKLHVTATNDITGMSVTTTNIIVQYSINYLSTTLIQIFYLDDRQI